MAGGNEDHEDSLDGTDEDDDLMNSTDQSECEDLDLGDMEYFDDSNEYCSVHENLKDDIRKALATYPESEEELGIPSVQIDETRSNLKYISAVVLTFTLKDISEHLLELWDLEDTPAIIMEMDNIHRGEFRSFGQLPTITVKKHSSEGHFIVGEQLKNFVLRLCREKFSLRTNESPSTVGSFFSMVYGLVKERLIRLSEYCVTCGEVLSSGGVLPSICDRDLCMYQYSELHLFDGLSVPRVSPQVLSLLLFAFANANLSHRRKDILSPAPPIKNMVELLNEAKSKQAAVQKKDAGDPNNLNSYEDKGSAHWNTTVSQASPQRSYHAFNSTESAMFSVLLENLPCPKEFLASVSAYHQFRKDWPMMSDIVDWLVISNRSYLEMVPRPMSVDFLHTDSQYCFVSDSPAKQAEFDQLVAENGGKTRFFFHGSPLENWHSIIRSGLKNMSGTKYQLVGAAYGKGIYLSPFLDFAIGYASRLGGGFSRRITAAGGAIMDRPIRSGCTASDCCDTERAEDLSCVALVEVVDCPEAYNEKTDEIFVVEKDQWCSIRMLLLYRSSDINNLHTAVDKVNGREYQHHARTSNRVNRAAAWVAAGAALGVPPPSSSSSSGAPAASTLQVPGGVAVQQSQQPQPTPHPMGFSSIPPTSQGLMSFMMNKFSNWTGGAGGSTSTSTSAADTLNQLDQLLGVSGGAASTSGSASDPLDQLDQIMQQMAAAAPNLGSRQLIGKLGKAKKLQRELRKKQEEKARLAAAGGGGVVLPEVAGGSVAPSTSPLPAALGTSLSSSSSSNVIVNMGNEEEEEDQPGTSGLQMNTEREMEETMKMALGDSEEANVLAHGKSDDHEEEKGWLEMRETRRLKKEKAKKNKKKGDDKDGGKKIKQAKESYKRKRSLFDSTPDVPSKTSSSPSNDKPDTDLTEEDMKILQMFAESDLDEDDVQVMKIVKKDNERNKKSSTKREGKKKDKKKTEMNEESDDDVEVLEAKKRSLLKYDDVLKMYGQVEEQMKKDESEDTAGPSSSSSQTTSAFNVLPFPPSSFSTLTAIPANRPVSVRRSYPPSGSSFSLSSSSSLSPSTTFPPPAPPVPPHSSLSSLQPAHSSRATMQTISPVSQQQARLQLLQQKMMMTQAQQQMLLINPTTASSAPPTTGTITAPSINVPSSGLAAAAGPGSYSFFSQMMGGMFPSRRRRRGTSADRAIPGDLTTITEDQREQIYRVVRMFRNSGFEERVNRHMNREEEKKEEDGEVKNEEEGGGGSGDSNNSSDM